MTLFLTSSPCWDHVPEGVCLPCILNSANGFVDALRAKWPQGSRVLIIAADPENYPLNDEMADTFRRAFLYHGLTMRAFTLLDARNAGRAEELVASSDFIMLGGGHVPTQNAFNRKIGLRALLEGYRGVIMGVSAGSMNCADTVYAQPEMPGESVDSRYERFIEGLGLTDVNILPHYQQVKDYTLDGRRLFEDITCGDSFGHTFYAIPDGSYVLCEGRRAEVFGECLRIADGVISLFCCEGASRVICEGEE